MRTWALIKDKKVFNVIAWDGDPAGYTPPDGVIAVEYDIDGESAPGIGWGYDNGEFTPPNN